jgi:hypothetical protein
MRYFWLLILCLLMPFKATWAENMASARAHNPMAVQAAKSHHDHCVDATRGDTKSDSHQSVLADDADCGTCHAGCSAVMPADLSMTVDSLDRSLNTAHLCAWAALPNPPPEKPQWHALV